MITDKVLRQRVQRGLTWIIEEGERYNIKLDRINVDQLSVQSSCDCVLGQGGGYGGFYRVLDNIGAEAVVQLGFDARAPRPRGAWIQLYQAYEKLTVFWREAILAHRASVEAMSAELEIALIEGVKA